MIISIVTWVWHKKEFGYISPQAEKKLREMYKNVENEKMLRKIKTHILQLKNGSKKTCELINSEVQEIIKEVKTKLDCEKKNIEYHPIQHV